MKKLLFAVLTISFITTEGYTASNKEDYELQEKCARDAKERFDKQFKDSSFGVWLYPGTQEDFAKDFQAHKLKKAEPVILTFEYQNHYNRNKNKCFMHVWAFADPHLITNQGKTSRYVFSGQTRRIFA